MPSALPMQVTTVVELLREFTKVDEPAEATLAEVPVIKVNEAPERTLACVLSDMPLFGIVATELLLEDITVDDHAEKTPACMLSEVRLVAIVDTESSLAGIEADKGAAGAVTSLSISSDLT